MKHYCIGHKTYGLIDKMIFNILFLTLCLAPAVFPQTNEISFGTCPNITTQEKFNETLFAGKWYEIKRFNNTLITKDCGLPQYRWNKNYYAVTYRTKNLQNGSILTANFTLRKQFLQVPGKYDLYINNNVKSFIPHYIMSTDYNTYGIVWGCSYRNNQNIQQLFLYSRTNMLSGGFFNKTIRPILLRNRINVTRLVDVVQDIKRCGVL